MSENRKSERGSLLFGRLLLAAGFAWLLLVDPRAWLRLDDATSRAYLAPTPQPNGAFFLLCIALYQLAVPVMAARIAAPRAVWVAGAAGGLLFAAADLSQIEGNAAWLGLAPIGTLICAVAAAAAAAFCAAEPSFRVAALLPAFGFALETHLYYTGLTSGPHLYALLGTRLLRLARVAALVLPLLYFLLAELRDRLEAGRKAAGEPPHQPARWLTIGMLAGAAGMPLVLTAAATIDGRLKYLLPLCADLVLAGTIAGAWLARRHASRVEFAGWIILAASMSAGMLMGGYAFEGPLPSPVGDYLEYPRQLLRHYHAVAIVLGLGLILEARAKDLRFVGLPVR